MSCMNTNDFFREALKYKMAENGVRQVDLSSELGIQRTQISAYLRNEGGFSENRKELISEYFKMNLLDMLLLGKNLLGGAIPNKMTMDSSPDALYYQRLERELDRKDKEIGIFLKENKRLRDSIGENSIDIIPAHPGTITIYEINKGKEVELGEPVVAWKIITSNSDKHGFHTSSSCEPLNAWGDVDEGCIGVQNPDMTITVFNGFTYTSFAELQKIKYKKE